MWKREEAPRPPQPVAPPAPPPVAPPSPTLTAPRTESVKQENAIVNIGKSVVIKGELSGSEDLTIEGQVEGKIELRQNILTIGPNAKIKAQVQARAVIVEGQVQGNIATSERIEIKDKGSVEGDLSSPRVAIADGAHFRGSIDMQQAKAGERVEKPAESKSATPAAPPTPIAAAPVGAAR
jgi:cytoskeletal protein CcmA (bactofilin family)